MAFPEGTVKTTWRFGLYGPTAQVEEAEMGLWGTIDTAHPPTNWQTGLDGLSAAAYAAWTAKGFEPFFNDSVKLESVQCATYGTDGRTLHEGVHSPTTKWVGTGTDGSLPWQLAWCFSLYTYTPGSFIPDARTRRGRMYLPPFHHGVLGDDPYGQLGPGTVSTLVTKMNQLLKAVSDHELETSGHALNLGVFSRAKSHVYSITDVAGDQILDTQRRRRKSEVPVRVAHQFGTDG